MISNLHGNSRIIIQPSATAINGFFWSLYAYGKKDKFLLIPNLLALILGIMTVIVVFI
ncbi:MAG: SemiSWEET family transporter [Candidatus Pacebacteria bacterium]|nr:SemiSWEET family transporter [Candidatus Paceibacterota bacterium]